jgi:hypothetical protein
MKRKIMLDIEDADINETSVNILLNTENNYCVWIVYSEDRENLLMTERLFQNLMSQIFSNWNKDKKRELRFKSK